MSRKLLVILLVFGLLVGNLMLAPVARGGTATVMIAPPVDMYAHDTGGSSLVMWRAVAGGATDVGSNVGVSVFVDGVAATDASWMYSNPSYDVYVVNGMRFTIPTSYEDGEYHTVSWLGFDIPASYQWGTLSVPGGSFRTKFPVGGTGYEWVPAATFGMEIPLSVVLSGPTTVDLVNGGTWTATATGGTAPYTYYWDWMPLGGSYHYNTPFDPIGPVGTSTYSHTWTTAGTYIVECTVQDATGTWASATKQVTAASVIGNYHALFIRYGDLGQYVNVQVFDSSGQPVTVGYTSGTQYGQYGQDGGFAWYTADYEATQITGGSYTWKWTMAFTVGGIQLHPDADMWFQTAIHLAIPNIDLQVMHHWTGLGESWDAWYGPTGNQLIPETPPTVTSTIPEWLQAVYDMFVRLFRYLFVPSASDFSSQLASGWILIASPVPSISPQYTIPFPNPNHLLAATGDSINIDFSGIQSYSGYSTYKTIVQAVLDALLVFVIISLVA